jgi:hypothetical protein
MQDERKRRRRNKIGESEEKFEEEEKRKGRGEEDKKPNKIIALCRFHTCSVQKSISSPESNALPMTGA